MKISDKTLKLNLIMGFVYPVVMLVVNFLIKQAIQRVLGIDFQGIQTVFSNFCDVFAFAFVGVGIAMTYNLYKPIANEDEDLVTATFRYFSKAFLIIAGIMVIVGLAAAALVMWSINADVDRKYLIIAYLLYLIGVVISGTSKLYFYFLTVQQKMYISRLIFCITEIVALIAELFILYIYKDYIIFLIAIIIKCITSVSVYLIYTRRKFGFVFKKSGAVNSEQKKKFNSDIKDLIMARAGDTLVSSTDTILASGLVSTAVAGCYSNYYFVFYGLSVFGQAFFDSFMAKIGRMLVVEDKRKSFEYFVKISVINIAVSAVLTCGCYLLIDNFITLWMDESVLLPHSISTIVSVNVFMLCMRYTTLEFRQAAGIFDKASIFILVRGISNVILSIVLGLWMGLFGILLATAITFAVTIYWYEPYLVLKYFGKKFHFELLYQLTGAAMAISAIWITGLLVGGMGAGSWPGLILKGILVVVIALAWCFLIFGIIFGIKKLAEKIK